MVTVADMGARALRKLGVAIVAQSASPGQSVTFTAAQLADRAVRELGVLVPESARSAPLPPVSQQTIAQGALRAVGVNPFAQTANEVNPPTTTAAIAQRALIRLGVTDADEAPAASDLAEATTVVGGILFALQREGLCNWLGDATPASAVEPLVLMTVQLLAASFGKSPSMDTYMQAEAMLRRQALASGDAEAIAEAKVASVHDAMTAQGLASWTIATVPAAFADDYIQMAATLLAPVITPGMAAPDRQVQQAIWDAAEDRLRRAARITTATTIANARVASIQDELDASNLVAWTDGAIPQAVADAYVALIVQSTAPSLGGKFDQGAYDMAMRRIRRVAIGGAAGQALAEQKVRAVHADLDARGLTRWSLFDVPDYAQEPYVLMAAYLLAPEVDAKADADWYEGSERKIMRLIALQTNRQPVVAVYF